MSRIRLDQQGGYKIFLDKSKIMLQRCWSLFCLASLAAMVFIGDIILSFPFHQAKLGNV